MKPSPVPGAAPGSSRAAPGRVLGYAAIGLLVAGATLVGRALYLKAKALLAGHLIRQAWSQTLETGERHPPWPWADTHPIGRVLIPSLGYDEIVLEGASPRNLAFGPARMMNGAAMGEPGNLILAGHRTSWFRPLEDVSVGDSLWLEWRDAASERGSRRGYRVAEIRIIDPDDPSFLAPTAADVVTLITCYPFGPSPTSPLRYVVRAEAVPAETGSPSAARVPAHELDVQLMALDVQVVSKTTWAHNHPHATSSRPHPVAY